MLEGDAAIGSWATFLLVLLSRDLLEWRQAAVDLVLQLRSFFGLLQSFRILILLRWRRLIWCRTKMIDHERDVAVELGRLLEHALTLAMQIVCR